jgi:galactokinase
MSYLSAVKNEAEGDFLEIFIPGRLCLFGEHSDWAGGMRRFNSSIPTGKTLVCGTNQGIVAKARVPSSPRFIFQSHLEAEPLNVPFTASALKEVASGGGIFSYACGVALVFLTNFKTIDGGGLEIIEDADRTNLPVGKGLASSAAVSVLVARAFNILYKLKGRTRFEMEMAYMGENLTPSRCGRMDQACAFGQDQIVSIAYDGDALDIETDIIVGKTLEYVIIDLNYKGKSTTKILQGLQGAFPRPRDSHDEALHSLLGEKNQRICAQALENIRDGDLDALGLLMNAVSENQKIAHELAATPLSILAITTYILFLISLETHTHAHISFLLTLLYCRRKNCSTRTLPHSAPIS